jgi:adenine-specific DNA-methyltransferase
MAAINDLLRQITDPALRGRLTEEVNRMSKNKKFGLVFEEHIPECTPLYGVPIKCGLTVARKIGKLNEIYTVKRICGDELDCENKATREKATFQRNELVSVAQFGEPIFPSLEPIDKVKNAPDDSLWHTIIEADNYHALQLLEYLYEGKVDCIYIDPPYNTGARDWKYNNDYVDSNDAYRHSKWLSMMQKRLKLAHRLLNNETGVLIITIDEHEVHHLRTLIEEIFREAYIQMATIVINQKGVSQGRLARTEEYAVYVFMPNAILPVHHDDYLSFDETSQTQSIPRWERLLRGGTDSRREDSPTLFYPVFVDPDKKMITGIGEIMPLGENPDLSAYPEKTVAWPIRTDGSFGRWQVSPTKFKELIDAGFARVGTYDKKRGTWTVLYLNRGTRKRIDDGEIIITGKDNLTGVVTVEFANPEARLRNIKTVWHRRLHDSGVYGSSLLSTIIGRDNNFTFPKSLYSTKDAVATVVRNNPKAIIVDFFAGSGTTLHAVNLLNAEDDGKRRCILVTNNEVSESEIRDLKTAGYQPGDSEWESRGICRSVTWPRTEYSILGKRTDGAMLVGEYFTSLSTTKDSVRSFYQLGFIENPTTLTSVTKKQIVALIGKDKLTQSLVKVDSRFIVSEKHTASVLFDTDAADEWLAALEGQEHIVDFYIVAWDSGVFNDVKTRIDEFLGAVSTVEPLKRPMSEGFPANVEYFKLGFLDKNSVSLGQQFAEILPLLWLKTGAVGERPELRGEGLPDMLILPQNSFAVLLDEDSYSKFADTIQKTDSIETVYFVTNSEEAFREMSNGIGIKQTYQLYRDYIDNFVIGSRRSNL